MAQWLVTSGGFSEVHEFASDSDIARSAVRRIMEGAGWVQLYDDETCSVKTEWRVTERHEDGTATVEAENLG